MLLHRRVTPNGLSSVPIYTPRRRETMWSKVSCLRKQHSNEETNLASNQRPSDPPTVRSKVRRANHYTTAPPCDVMVRYKYWAGAMCICLEKRAAVQTLKVIFDILPFLRFETALVKQWRRRWLFSQGVEKLIGETVFLYSSADPSGGAWRQRTFACLIMNRNYRRSNLDLFHSSHAICSRAVRH